MGRAADRPPARPARTKRGHSLVWGTCLQYFTRQRHPRPSLPAIVISLAIFALLVIPSTSKQLRQTPPGREQHSLGDRSRGHYRPGLWQAI
jgi:hypothetical protein